VTYGGFGDQGPDAEVVLAVFDAFARRDRSAMAELFTDDAEVVLEGTAQLVGRDQPYRGRDGILRYFEDVESAWEVLELHPESVRSVQGSVVVFGTVRGRAQGRDVELRALWTWQLRGGRVISLRANALGAA
jgi:ketosteroid isomerase-like protein